VQEPQTQAAKQPGLFGFLGGREDAEGFLTERLEGSTSPRSTMSPRSPIYDEGCRPLPDLPPVVLKLMEVIVAEEIAGLGECLSICAQRSRTLKLLGFQHLHFDARLQGFLESRAGTVLRPVADAVLLARGLQAFREAARHSFLWRRLASHQHQRRSAARKLQQEVDRHRAERRRLKEPVARMLEARADDCQRQGLLDWSRSVLQTKIEDMTSRYEELKARNEMQHEEKEALREKHVQERLQKFSALLGQVLGQCFGAWKDTLEEGRERLRRQQRLAKSFFNATEALMESVVGAWAQATVDNRVTRKRQEMLREQKLREVDRILRTGIGQGAELYCILQAWHRTMVHRRQNVRSRSKTAEAAAQFAADHLRLAFSAWCGFVKAEQEAQKRRFQSVERTALVSLHASLAVVWAAWHKGAVSSRRKQKVEQHMCGLMRSQEDNQQGCFLLRWKTAVLGQKLRQLDCMVVSEKPGRERALAKTRWLRSSARQRKVLLFRAWIEISAKWHEKRMHKDRFVASAQQEDSLTLSMLLRAWQGAARAELCAKREAEMQQLKAKHKEELEELRESFIGRMRQEKEAQLEARQENLRKHWAGSQEALRSNSFKSWRDYALTTRRQRLLQSAALQRGEAAAQRAAAGLMQSLLGTAFGAWAEDCRKTKAAGRQTLAKSMLQRQLAGTREQTLSSAFTGWHQHQRVSQGLAKRHHSVASAALAKCSRANLVDSFAAWKETIRSEMLAHLKHELLRTKNSLKLFEKELEEAKQRRREELVSRFMSTSTSIKSNFLKAWRLQVEERTRKAQRSAVALRIATRGDASLQADVLAGWVREVGKGRAAKATQQQQQALLRRLASTMAESRKSVLQAWRHWLEAQKTARRRLMQGHARAARQMADNDQPLLMLLFQGFRMLLVERRMRVQAAKECGIYKKRAVGRDRASAEKTAMQQDNALLSRATLGWMMLTSVSGAVAQERRRLARTAGLGRANAVRLRHRIHELRVLWAWFLSSKLRIWVEKYGTSMGPFLNQDLNAYVVKQLEDVPSLRPRSPKSTVVVQSLSRPQSPENVQVFTSHIEPVDIPEAKHSEMPEESTAAAAAAAASWYRASGQEMSRSLSPTRIRVTCQATSSLPAERQALASKAATSDCDYRQLLEHHRREIRENREAARRASPERVAKWGAWAK